MAGPLVSVSLLMTRGHFITHWAVLGTEWPGLDEHLSWPCGILAAGVQGPRSRPPQCCEVSQWQEPFRTAEVETRLQFVHLLEQSWLCATHAPRDPCSSNRGHSVSPRTSLTPPAPPCALVQRSLAGSQGHPLTSCTHTPGPGREALSTRILHTHREDF